MIDNAILRNAGSYFSNKSVATQSSQIFTNAATRISNLEQVSSSVFVSQSISHRNVTQDNQETIMSFRYLRYSAKSIDTASKKQLNWLAKVKVKVKPTTGRKDPRGFRVG
jgi:hypothetical protein